MPANSGTNLRQYPLLSTTVEVPVGSEPAQYIAVTLDGTTSATNARGVSNVSRDGFVTVVLNGYMPCKVKNGQTIAKGASVASDANGELIVATALTGALGVALESVTVANNEYIEIFVNPRPVLA